MNAPSKPAGLTILGIETSCDETAAAIVRRDAGGDGHILSNIVRSQESDHAPYGGVVPEIAARAHVELVDRIIVSAMREAGVQWGALDGVAATAGPGLIGGLIVGLSTAKAIALVKGLPLIAINHLEAHALTVGLTDALGPPYLLLIVSGGHTQLIIVRDIGVYERIGTTLDDALGEAFDKTAKLLGLGFPGGPEVERCARSGDPARFAFPTPMRGRERPDFSFAGLKTAVRHAAQKIAPVSQRDIADLCAGFQQAAITTVCERVSVAMDICRDRLGPHAPRHLVVAGGVAANARLRAGLGGIAAKAGFSLVIPPPALCTDNAAMIAWTGACHLARGHRDPLDIKARARWPLDANAPKAIGAGVKA